MLKANSLSCSLVRPLLVKKKRGAAGALPKAPQTGPWGCMQMGAVRSASSLVRCGQFHYSSPHTQEPCSGLKMAPGAHGTAAVMYGRGVRKGMGAAESGATE